MACGGWRGRGGNTGCEPRTELRSRRAHVWSSAAAAWGAPPTVRGRVPLGAATGRAAREASRSREVEARQRLPSGRAAPRRHRPLVLHAAADAQRHWPRPRLLAFCLCAARACSCTPEPPPPPRPWPPASRAAALPYLQPRRVPRLGLEPSAVLRALLASRVLARPPSSSRARAHASARRHSIRASTGRFAGAAAGSGRGEGWRSGGRPHLAGKGARAERRAPDR